MPANRETAPEARVNPTAQRTGVAFLLAQVGAVAAGRFAERIADLDLTPPQTGLLRVISQHPGSNQRELGDRLGLFPSRVVTFVDDLEDRGFVRRERSRTDRRQYALYLTDQGQVLMGQIATLARAHENDLCQPLDESERAHLAVLLARIAEQQGLTTGVHPGYRHLNETVEPDTTLTETPASRPLRHDPRTEPTISGALRRSGILWREV